jgi:replicative DNA helicase
MNEALMHSEQLVIGSLIVDNDCFDEIGDLKTEVFSSGAHRVIFSEIRTLLAQGKPVDLIIVAQALEDRGSLGSVGNLPYLGALASSIVSTKNVRFHADRLINQWKLRQFKSLLSELSSDAEALTTPIQAILDKAESSMFSLVDGEIENDIVEIREAVFEAVDWEDADKKGAPTGLRDLDRLTGGFCPSNLIIVAGRPSMGKSSLAFQIAEHVSRTQSVAVFSLEMSKREIGTRMLNFHTASIGRSEAVAHLVGLKMHVDTKPGATISHIRSKCRKVKRKHGLSMIVVDYLQLMKGDGDNRNQEIGSISRGLKSLAKEFDVPVVALSQLSRRVEERADKRPLMSDLRDSGEIEQDADLILFIYRDEVYHPETEFKGLAEILIKKNRNGATGDITTKFDGAVTRFLDYQGQPILRTVKTNKSHERGFSFAG